MNQLVILTYALSGWFLCGYIARSIIKGNNKNLKELKTSSRRKDTIMYVNIRKWMKHSFLKGPFGLITVFWRMRWGSFGLRFSF